MMYRLIVCLLLPLFASTLYAEDIFRLGIIGTDTGHVRAFNEELRSAEAPALFSQFRITAAYPGGMPDNPSSWNVVNASADYLVERNNATLFASVEEMLPHVDGILLLSQDARPNFEHAKLVIAAGKPLYIGKPMAASLADVIEMFRLAEANNVPIFSSSSLRFSPGYQEMRNEKPLGNIIGARTWAPCLLCPEARQPDMFWYGIHGVEILFTLMETGVQTVSRTHTANTDLAVGVWDGGRIGTFRGSRTGGGVWQYGGYVFAERGNADAGGFGGNRPLVEAFCNFFLTGEPPVAPEETIELFAFMEGADISRDRGGVPVCIAEVIETARNQVRIRADIVVTTGGAVLLDGNPIAIDRIAPTFDTLVAHTPNSRVKVILRAERDAPHDVILAVCNNLGRNAIIANFLYVR